MSKTRLTFSLLRLKNFLPIQAEQQLGNYQVSIGSIQQNQLGLQQYQAQRNYADGDSLKKTALYDFHVKHKGQMVPFGGWSMPLKYADTIVQSTHHTRSQASLFDVSHMCGLTVEGKDAIDFVEKQTVIDLQATENGNGAYSLFTNDKGGIIDDTIISRVSDNKVYLVVNAGCKDKDVSHLDKQIQKYQSQGGEAEMKVHQERGLLALQGPLAQKVLQSQVSDFDLQKMYFGQYREINVAGIPCWLTRGGYTGEDGFEISVPPEGTIKLAELLSGNEAVKLAGLGARDILRLEAGLCLYGNDIDDTTSPIEASLTWAVAKSRRDPNSGRSTWDFPGAEVIKQHATQGIRRRRVPLISLEGPPIRSHDKVLSADGSKQIGEITSGAKSPTTSQNIAMAYIEKGHDKAGNDVLVTVRNKHYKAQISKGPFIQTHYHKP